MLSGTRPNSCSQLFPPRAGAEVPVARKKNLEGLSIKGEKWSAGSGGAGDGSGNNYGKSGVALVKLHTDSTLISVTSDWCNRVSLPPTYITV